MLPLTLMEMLVLRAHLIKYLIPRQKLVNTALAAVSLILVLGNAIVLKVNFGTEICASSVTIQNISI